MSSSRKIRSILNEGVAVSLGPSSENVGAGELNVAVIPVPSRLFIAGAFFTWRAAFDYRVFAGGTIGITARAGGTANPTPDGAAMGNITFNPAAAVSGVYHGTGVIISVSPLEIAYFATLLAGFNGGTIASEAFVLHNASVLPTLTAGTMFMKLGMTFTTGTDRASLVSGSFEMLPSSGEIVTP